jgi:hypothetical protein
MKPFRSATEINQPYTSLPSAHRRQAPATDWTFQHFTDAGDHAIKSLTPLAPADAAAPVDPPTAKCRLGTYTAYYSLTMRTCCLVCCGSDTDICRRSLLMPWGLRLLAAADLPITACLFADAVGLPIDYYRHRPADCLPTP